MAASSNPSQDPKLRQELNKPPDQTPSVGAPRQPGEPEPDLTEAAKHSAKESGLPNPQPQPTKEQLESGLANPPGE